MRRQLAVIFLHILPSILILLLVFFGGCESDHTVLTREVVVEVEKVIEVPVYIEIEVPTDGEVQVDSFIQSNAVNGIDILWVIDTSGSMDDHQAELMQGIDAMMNALPEAGWRLAMISADPGVSVHEQQFPLVPGDDMLDAESMFAGMLRGSKEKGFDSAYRYIVDNAYSGSWMRWDAALLIVFVSDENDQSDSQFTRVQDFIGWYGSLRSSVYLSAIVNFPHTESLCAPPAHEVGTRYIEAVRYFEGILVDICSDDWSAGVSSASSLVTPIEELSLSRMPKPSTLRVFINGQLNIGWHYDSGLNSVKFNPIPPSGSLVEIGYIVDVGP